MRYKGQGWEIPVTIEDERFDDLAAEQLEQAFTKAYVEFFGRAIDHVVVEIVSWSVLVASITEAPAPLELRRDHATDAIVVAHRPVHDATVGADVDAAIVGRADLGPATRILGPAVIVESQTTTILASHHQAVVQADGALLITRSRR